VSQQKLDRSEVLRPSVDERGLRAVAFVRRIV